MAAAASASAAPQYLGAADPRLAPSRNTGTDGTMVNGRNQRLHTVEYMPAGEPKAAVFLCHGYAHYTRALGCRLADPFTDAGYAVFGIDHHGMGESEGLKCYVEDFNHLIEDFAQFVKERRAARGLEGKKVFVIAQSMGGAIALLSTLPGAPLADVVDGLVLVAPMCAIAPGMRPPEWQISLLRWTAYVIPTWPITPTPDLIDRCYRDPAELEKAKNNPLGFRSKPRLLTALQMNDATERIEKRMPEVQVPFLVLHGTDDVVTAPEASKALHAKAASKDKSIKLYDGLWHALFSEPDGEGQKVTADTLAWIEERA